MSTYSADYIERLMAALEAFDTAFERWMETQDEVDHRTARGMLWTVSEKDGQDTSEVLNRELAVAEAAGMASRAVAITGSGYRIQGIGDGVVDPIANWSLMSSPRALFSPRDVRMTVASVRGRLKLLLAEAEAQAGNGVPGFAPSELHPIIWTAAAAHWTTHQYRVAVREAAEELNQHWKAKLDRRDIDDTSFWQQTLSGGDPEPGRPKLRWPGDRDDKTVRSMRGGLLPLTTSLIKGLAEGLNLTVRNPTTHSRQELPEQEAMERLAAYSYLARTLDGCKILHAAEEEGPPSDD